MRPFLPVLAFASFVAILSCSENLPSGPVTFPDVGLSVVSFPNTLVVGDQRSAQAVVTDSSGNQITGLSFTWTSSDTTIAALASPDTSSGRARTLVGLHSGHSLVTVALPDPRFAVKSVSKTATVLVAGVHIATSHDTTATAINDTGLAIGSALVHLGTATVPAPAEGIQWVHLGTHTTLFGQGDTMRYVAKTDGTDTLIARDSLCLALAKCADTAVIIVSQQLTLTLSAHAFNAWNVGDSVGPTSIVLADHRGIGEAGTSIRFVPVGSADSAIVQPTAPLGTSNPVTGLMAKPELVTTGNGSARVKVLGIGPNGSTVVATDSITAVVRQVARVVAVSPLRATMTQVDSIPIRLVAFDSRGNVIPDATLTPTASGINVHGIFAGPSLSSQFTATIVATLSGAAVPANNPLAPQVAFAVDTAQIIVAPALTMTSDSTLQSVSVYIVGPTGLPAPGQPVFLSAPAGLYPNSVISDPTGFVTTFWAPPNIVGSYTLTGVRSSPTPIVTTSDSSGLIVIRQSVAVTPGKPYDSTSIASISATTLSIANSPSATVTVNVMDKAGNVVTNATPSMFVATASGGTLGAFTCNFGMCSATYTAPGAPGPQTIHVTMLGVDILNSPLMLTITP